MERIQKRGDETGDETERNEQGNGIRKWHTAAVAMILDSSTLPGHPCHPSICFRSVVM